MKTKVLVGILLFLIVINLATIGTYAYHAFFRPHPGPDFGLLSGEGRGGRVHLPPPDMTREQQEQLHAIIGHFVHSTDSLQRAAQGLEEDLLSLLRQDKPQESALTEKLRAISDTRYRIGLEATQHLLQTKSFLNREQQEAFFDAFMRLHGSGPGPSMGDRHHRPDHPEAEHEHAPHEKE